MADDAPAFLIHWMPIVLAGYVLWQASITRNTGDMFSLFAIKLIPAALAVVTLVAILTGVARG